jgi:hypothetical protein
VAFGAGRGRQDPAQHSVHGACMGMKLCWGDDMFRTARHSRHGAQRGDELCWAPMRGTARAVLGTHMLQDSFSTATALADHACRTTL